MSRKRQTVNQIIANVRPAMSSHGEERFRNRLTVATPRSNRVMPCQVW